VFFGAHLLWPHHLRMAHRKILWAVIQEPVGLLTAKLEATCLLMHRLHGPDSTGHELLALPLHQRGCALRQITPHKTIAACISAAALTQVRMHEGPVEI
jgi:hypothetical protein